MVKLVRWTIRLLLLILFVAFAIANRGAVTVSLDPLPVTWPVPLFLIVFVAMFIGFVAGGGVAWMRAGRWRQRARSAEREQRKLESEKQTTATTSGETGTALTVPKAAA